MKTWESVSIFWKFKAVMMVFAIVIATIALFIGLCDFWQWVCAIGTFFALVFGTDAKNYKAMLLRK